MFWKIMKRTAGVGLLTLGVVALVTPFTPGSLLFLAGGAKLLGLEKYLPEKLQKKITKEKKLKKKNMKS